MSTQACTTGEAVGILFRSDDNGPRAFRLAWWLAYPDGPAWLREFNQPSRYFASERDARKWCKRERIRIESVR